MVRNFFTEAATQSYNCQAYEHDEALLVSFRIATSGRVFRIAPRNSVSRRQKAQNFA